MIFSMIFEAQIVDTSRVGEYQVMHECVEQAVLAEKMGFDKVWAVEHHCLKWYAHMSAPETFLAYVAAKTERIRIGHGVVCLPFRMNHPVKVAERVAMLDILSGGRVEFGIGKGGTPQEAGAFQTGIDEIPAQLEESARMIPRMWMSDEYEHHSPSFELPARPIIPKPHQDPHPPMYMASVREESLIQAGEWGMGALVLGFGGPEEIAQKNAIYREAVKRRTPDSQVPAFPVEHLSALCPAIVLDDEARARAIGHRGQRYFTEAINHWYARGEGVPPPRAEIAEMSDEEALEQAATALIEYFREHQLELDRVATQMYNHNHAYGTAEAAIGYVERLVAAGADEIMFLIQMGTVPQWAALETIRNIGEKVIPHFR